MSCAFESNAVLCVLWEFMLCCYIVYVTKWRICADVPLRNYSLTHCYIVDENKQQLQPRQNRLAALAENVRAWEDDLRHSQIK